MLGPVTTLVVVAGVLGAVVAVVAGLVAGRRGVGGGHGAAEHAGEELFRARAARFLRRRLDPEAATGLALTVALGLVFAAALGFGLVSDMVTSETGLYRLDASAAAWGAENATPTSTWLLGLVTWLGATVTVLAVVSALGALEWLRRRRLAVLAFLVTVVVGQNLIANSVKAPGRAGAPARAPPGPLQRLLLPLRAHRRRGRHLGGGRAGPRPRPAVPVQGLAGRRGRRRDRRRGRLPGAAGGALADRRDRRGRPRLRLVRGLLGRLRRRPAPLRRPGRAGRGRGG